MEKRLTGRIAPERIRLFKTPRPPDGAIERFLAIGDPTGLTSDAMDELGIALGAIGASVLKPTIPGTTMVGPALTVRNVLQRADPHAGALVMGGIRDIAHSRMVGFPLWSSEVSPVTGKWRLETVEINGSVQIGEVRVEPGDLVVADDSGVCFIPRDYILEVLELAEKKAKAEDIRCKAIVGGVAVPEISRSTYGE